MVGGDAPVAIGKSAVVEELDMPKVEMSYFDGNCTDYLRFTKEFEYYVENRVEDPGQRMLYLLHYCKGRDKAAIRECVILRPEGAYARAKGILQELFGKIHVIARNRTEDMTVAEDGEALSLEEQETCATTMHYGTAVMLGVIPVKVPSHGKEIDTYAFLDNGFDVTLVTNDLLSGLGLEGTPSSMTLTTIDSASFRLYTWIANRADVLKSVTLKEPTMTSRLFNGDTVKVKRTLGLEWNSEIDCFAFPLKIPRKPVTRRDILSAVSSISDPLGILSPLLLLAKLMLQSLCKQNMGWDQSGSLAELDRRRGENSGSENP
ncbi:unnamed protein product [Trichobilharzia regenti]|nr:unnamed protein product [Trichobilharzia regenti]